VCRHTGMSRATIYRKIAKGDFPAGYMIKGTRRRVWKDGELDTFDGKRAGFRIAVTGIAR
jgi:predicted DNA-binding transcriptional regulator AlpA